MSRTYVVERLGDHFVRVRVLERDGSGPPRPVGLLEHRVEHAPHGMDWGHRGAGPADLARSILWDHLGREPEPWLYQDYKQDCVAVVNPAVARWQTDSEEIDGWLAIRSRRARALARRDWDPNLGYTRPMG